MYQSLKILIELASSPLLRYKSQGEMVSGKTCPVFSIISISLCIPLCGAPVVVQARVLDSLGGSSYEAIIRLSYPDLLQLGHG